MLVITRKSGERIRIGDDITVTVLEIAGSSVRIGIDAPANVAIYRHEIWEEAARENQAAASTSVDELPSPKHTS
ncbi:MAG: carbon storage regulator CsrA [Thermoleophilia bacterium]|nr:carbon storage regulator CsrA [Thermoleophilia bacterium]